MTSPPLLLARGIGKQFPGVRALDGVDLRLERGEVLAVVGENGAGKSTLMKILAGLERADAGEVLLDGKPTRLDSVAAAQRAGIALIHQELMLADNLDVGANVFLGREPRRLWGGIDFARIEAESARVLARLGLEIPPRTPLADLSIGRRQLVEIAKALSANARILIMDEPTSSLTQSEARHLFEVVRSLRASGVGVIYISHRLGEVRELADRVVVLRDGRNAGELVGEAIDHDAMVRLMVGRDVAQFYHHEPRAPGAALLAVEGLRTRAHPAHRVSLTVRRGEIVGLAGLVGAGRSELLETLFGVRAPVAGRIEVEGRAVAARSAREAMAAGLALVPEDRKTLGLVLEATVRENLALPSLRHQAVAGFVRRGREQELARGTIEELGIRTPSDTQIVENLSGGNQQKVVLGKWLALRPRVLLLDEPTRGIDVGAKEEIYALIERFTAAGGGVLVASSELEELLHLCDRILVMHEGRLAGELGRGEFSEEAVMRLATGGNHAA